MNLFFVKKIVYNVIKKTEGSDIMEPSRGKMNNITFGGCYGRKNT